MFGHETKPAHFFIPMVISIIGGIFAHIKTWEWVGYLIYVVAGANVFFLIYTVVKDKQLEKIRAAHDHIAEIMTLDAAKTKTKVVIEKTDLEGNNFSQAWREVPIDPVRLKIFATGILQGRKLRVREWTPLTDGKLFSDTEWDTFITWLKMPDPERKDLHFIEQRNPGVKNSVYDWTPAGMKWLKTHVDEHVLTPISA